MDVAGEDLRIFDFVWERAKGEAVKIREVLVLRGEREIVRREMVERLQSLLTVEHLALAVVAVSQDERGNAVALDERVNQEALFLFFPHFRPLVLFIDK